MAKKLIAFFLAMMILPTLTACGKQDNTNDTSSSVPSATSTEILPSETVTQSVTEPPAERESTILSAILNSILEKFQYNGIAYIINNNNEILYNHGFGTANTEKNIAITSDTVFCIASNSKQFTATAIMLLQQDGKLSVNDTIDKYFPEYQYSRQITIHQLLCMRSGIKDYMDYAEEILQDISQNFQFDQNTTAKEMRQAIQQWFFKQELDFIPDEQFEYSNSNYMLLAEIVEQVSGMSYEEYIRKNIFEVLDMKDTTFYDLCDITSDDFAQPMDKTYVDYMQYKGILFGAGDIVSSAKDLGKWFTAVRNHTIISEDILQTMTTNYSSDTDNLPYGYGYMIDQYGFYHTGEIFSYVSVGYLSTVKDYTVIFLSNKPSADMETLALTVNNEMLSSDNI
ncbi:MAG: beta-lactamase family protein [Clostridia bacterium]|nr:beta-lactamase family protein [Clostridia bacterium]